ncbi:TPA: hypothetical protein EYP13_03300 [Candidatus Micrarchaeota archaeon]|nr:hypothetical protein [Candidatus Micrarchaeota archaeon]
MDYILSKMVLLIFLLLLVSAFTLVQQSLSSYFVQQAAKGLASGIASYISQIVTTVRSSSEQKAFALPPALEAGREKLPYDINVVVYQREGICYVGILVMDQGAGRPLAFESVPVGKPRDVNVHVCYRSGNLFARSSGLKDQYVIVSRQIDLTTGQMSLTMCSSSRPAGSCGFCGGDLC